MKKQSQIAELVYDRTFFPSGKYMHFISIIELCGLFDRIIQTNEAAEYMRAIPFYRAPHWQHEFEHHRFFCKKLTEGENARELLRACEVDEYGILYKGVIRFYEEDDVQSFHQALKDYIIYMDELVGEIYRYLTEQCNVKQADLLRGSLCFEVYAE